MGSVAVMTLSWTHRFQKTLSLRFDHPWTYMKEKTQVVKKVIST
jgi:hypothetical protein